MISFPLTKIMFVLGTSDQRRATRIREFARSLASFAFQFARTWKYRRPFVEKSYCRSDAILVQIDFVYTKNANFEPRSNGILDSPI